MKRNAKIIVPVTAAVVIVAAIIGILLKTTGGNFDVVGKESTTSFNTILQTVPGQVKADDRNAGWSLSAPDETIRFIWSENYSQSPLYDVMLELDAAPFVDAGLDTSKLPENYTAYEGMLMVGTKLGNDDLKYNGEPTALSAYEQIVKNYRKSINYHTALDHYGVMLGDGNMFEWANDLAKNSLTGENQDKDLVFVLNPEPLITAGVDPEKVAGWTYAQVPTDDGDVWKLLKPFNLK